MDWFLILALCQLAPLLGLCIVAFHLPDGSTWFCIEVNASNIGCNGQVNLEDLERLLSWNTHGCYVMLKLVAVAVLLLHR